MGPSPRSHREPVQGHRCLGICPQKIVFDMWCKGDVAEERAGKLVRMAEGQAVTYKITKKLADMEDIEGLPGVLRETLGI